VNPTAADQRGGRRVLVLGGARSGKSAYAESLLSGHADVVYCATGRRAGEDPEWAARIADHRSRRPPGWRTVETTDVAVELRNTPRALLVDCLTLWLTAAMDDCGAWDDRPGHAGALAARIEALMEAWRDTTAHAVAVSNEVGWGVVPETRAGRMFRDELGVLNARFAGQADEVWLVVAGIPQRLR